MNNGLSKKEKKQMSALITKKLEAMGVKDEISYIASGKKIKRPVFDAESNQFKLEDGKLVMEELDVPVAMNALRRTVRTLRKAPVEQIISFLEMPLNQEASQPETPAQAETSEVENEPKAE